MALELGRPPLMSRTAAIVSLSAIASFISVAAVLPAFDVRQASVLVVLACAMGAAVAALARRRHLAPAVTCLLSGVGVSLFLLAASGAAPGSVWHELIVVPRGLLSETPPLSGPTGLLDPVLLVAWMCASVTTDLLLRAKIGGSAPVGLVAPVMIFVAAFAVGPATPDTPSYTGPALLVVLALAAVACRAPLEVEASRPRGVSLSVRPTVGLAAAATAAIVASSLAAFVVPARTARAVARRAVPVSQSYLTDPLDAIASLRSGESAAAGKPLFRADLNGSSSGYLGAVVMEEYDGGSWRVDSTFLPTGGRIPVSPPVGDMSVRAQVVQRIDIDARLPVPMLPVLATPTMVSGPRVLADPATAMVLPEGAEYMGLSYRAVSSPEVTLAEVSQAGLIDRSLDTGDTDLDLPPDSAPAVQAILRYLGALTGLRPTASAGFLDAAVDGLRSSDRRVQLFAAGKQATARQSSASNLGGTALAQVINSVTVDRAATPEQFATFVAVAARGLGIPARLVSGFRLAPSSDGRPLPPGRYAVKGTEAWTWLEVPVVGSGWVIVDPTPDAITGSSAPPPEPAQATPTTLPTPKSFALTDPATTGSHPLAPPVSRQIRRHSLGVWNRAIDGGAALMIVTMVPLAVLAATRRRRRRVNRSTDDSRELAAGAWLELLDGLERAGMKAEPAATSSEVAREAGAHFGSSVQSPVAVVGRLADRALFDRRGAVDAVDADAAWRLQESVARFAMGTLDRRQRMRARVTLRGHKHRRNSTG